MFRMLHLRQSREVNVFMSCCSQRLLNADPTTAQLIPTLSAQKRTTALRERSPSRWLGAQGSSHNQNSCSTATVRAQTVCVSSLLPRNGNLTYLAASSQSFVDFSQEHFLPDSEEVTDGSGDGQKEDKEFEAAKNSAAGSLSLRPHSRKELESKLREKGYSANAICRALDRLKDLELQSDADYAEVFTRSKWRQSRWAPSRIQQELIRKGVSRGDCLAALESVFGESSRGRVRVDLDDLEEADARMSTLFGTEGVFFGLTNMSIGCNGMAMNAGRVDQQLLASAQRQADMTASLPSETRKRRLTGWLLRRGHDWETVSKIVTLLKL